MKGSTRGHLKGGPPSRGPLRGDKEVVCPNWGPPKGFRMGVSQGGSPNGCPPKEMPKGFNQGEPQIGGSTKEGPQICSAKWVHKVWSNMGGPSWAVLQRGPKRGISQVHPNCGPTNWVNQGVSQTGVFHSRYTKAVHRRWVPKGFPTMWVPQARSTKGGSPNGGSPSGVP